MKTADILRHKTNSYFEYPCFELFSHNEQIITLNAEQQVRWAKFEAEWYENLDLMAGCGKSKNNIYIIDEDDFVSGVITHACFVPHIEYKHLKGVGKIVFNFMKWEGLNPKIVLDGQVAENNEIGLHQFRFTFAINVNW